MFACCRTGSVDLMSFLYFPPLSSLSGLPSRLEGWLLYLQEELGIQAGSPHPGDDCGGRWARLPRRFRRLRLRRCSDRLRPEVGAAHPGGRWVVRTGSLDLQDVAA